MPETVTCHQCGSTQTSPQPQKTRLLKMNEAFGLCRCSNCTLLFLSPRPTAKELATLYAQETFFQAENVTRLARHPVFYGARMQRLERWKPQRGTMLGIGCLEGGFALGEARKRGWQVLAVEFVQSVADFARQEQGLEVLHAPTWDLSGLQDRKFDAIYSHILEHVPDPRGTLRRCRELLHPDGILMLEVPNQFHSLKDKIKEAVFGLLGSRALPHFYGEASPHFHLNYFTPATIRRMLASEGFEVLELRTYLGDHPFYLANPRARRLQKAIYAIGGFFERGPSIELIARLRPPHAIPAA